MKVRKLLALVLTLLLVLAYGAFAAEGEAQEPGQQTAAQPAQQEAAATQAFERSLAVKGIFVWQWNWTQNTNTVAGTKNIFNIAWQSLQMNLVYKVTKDVRIEATLYNTIRWGEAANAYSDGRSTTSAFVPSSYDYGDSFAVAGSNTAPTAKNLIRLEEINLVWNVGGFVNDIYVGRVTNPWGFAGGLMLGAKAGVDRIKWVGKTKMFGYLALPVFFIELRSDASTTLQGDERVLIEPALVLVGPGKFIEVLGITWAYDGLQKRTSAGDPNNDFLAAYNLVGLSMKMRAGSLMVINFEFIGIMGRVNNAPDFFGMQYHTRLDFAKIFLNAVINLGMITLTPEITFLTAPNVDVAGGAAVHKATLVPWVSTYYHIGGLLMNAQTNYFGGGLMLGLFTAAVKAEFKLLGGSLIPWLKLSWGTTVSKYTMTTGYAYQSGGTKSLGFEIDLGVDITLTDGLTLMFDFGFLMLPSAIKNGTQAGDFSGKKNPMCIDVKLLFKF